MRTFSRTFFPAFAFIFGLTACQTLGVESDPDRTTKAAIASASIVTDAVAAYCRLPGKESGLHPYSVPERCRDAKMIMTSVAASFEPLRYSERPSIFLTAGLLYAQFQVAKTIADAPAPTSPEAPPTPAVAAYLQGIGMADILVSTADDRVRDAIGPNTSVVELLDELQDKVASLP